MIGTEAFTLFLTLAAHNLVVFILITSLLVKSKCEPELIPFIGNMYAGLATKIIGNSEPVKKIDLIRSINSILS